VFSSVVKTEDERAAVKYDNKELGYNGANRKNKKSSRYTFIFI
jgi:hypothetical protein